MPRKKIATDLKLIRKILQTKKVLNHQKLSRPVVVVFLSKAEAQKLNFKTRKKNYATDILSFSPADPETLGELIICPEIIQQQAKEHGLTQSEELGYMLIHGLLHLLGYEHETSKKDEKKMMDLQEFVFEKLF